jgi:hypothetical protein
MSSSTEKKMFSNAAAAANTQRDGREIYVGVVLWSFVLTVLRMPSAGLDAFYTRRSTSGCDSPEKQHRDTKQHKQHFGSSSMNEFLFFHRMLCAKAKEQTFENFSFCN